MLLVKKFIASSLSLKSLLWSSFSLNSICIERFMFSLAIEAILTISFFTLPTAIAGASKNLSSINVSLCFASCKVSLSGIIRSVSLTSRLTNGNNTMVVNKLKSVWKFAICRSTRLPLIITIKRENSLLHIHSGAMQITQPSTLNNKCIIAVRFALVEVPIEEIIAVTHVPIFEPKIINTAVSSFKAPASATKIPVTAAEL